jgi:hypothetical protein
MTLALSVSAVTINTGQFSARGRTGHRLLRQPPPQSRAVK